MKQRVEVTRAMHKRMVELREKGHTNGEIANLMGVVKSTVIRHLGASEEWLAQRGKTTAGKTVKRTITRVPEIKMTPELKTVELIREVVNRADLESKTIVEVVRILVGM